MRIDSASSLGAPRGPTNPFHVSRVYGQVVQPARSADAVASIGPAATSAARAQSAKFERLVAAVVPGKVDFGPGPAVDTGRSSAAQAVGADRATPPAAGRAGPDDGVEARAVLPFYTRPGDRQAAATALQVGRRLDVAG